MRMLPHVRLTLRGWQLTLRRLAVARRHVTLALRGEAVVVWDWLVLGREASRWRVGGHHPGVGWDSPRSRHGHVSIGIVSLGLVIHSGRWDTLKFQ